MHIVNTIQSVREQVAKARAEKKTIGFVPTMGALHQGHISLITAAGKECDYIVVSIFVNPAQFAPNEDFDKYPRDIDTDAEICKSEGADLVFAPSVSEMYPDKNVTWVNVESITKNLCGQSRPTFFRGVTTVCTKLFNIVQPDIAFFGQKDAQQAITIKRMVRDMNMPLNIRVCPIIREPDGLAASSRNRYLSNEERKDALLLNKALTQCRQMIEQGQTKSSILIEEIKQLLAKGKFLKPDYISIVDIETVEPIDVISQKALIAVAAQVGTTRLIDNIIVDLTGSNDTI